MVRERPIVANMKCARAEFEARLATIVDVLHDKGFLLWTLTHHKARQINTIMRLLATSDARYR